MTYLSTILADSPQVVYALDEPSGTTANDTSGNSNNGTIHGSPTLGVAGPISSHTAATINADGDYAASTATFNNHLAGATLECWVKKASAPATQMLLAMVGSYNTNSQSMALFIATSGFAATTCYDGATKFATGSVNVCDGNWHLVTATYTNSGHVIIYTDGANAVTGSAIGSLYNGAFPFEVGGNITGGSPVGVTAAGASAAYGVLYPSPLSATQIAAHYTASLPASTSAPWRSPLGTKAPARRAP